ncbi:MAG: twin-arginine translocase subunit TatC [Armatimonadota bacterium]
MTEDIEYSFWDHLNEARNGILRSLLYVVAGTALAWVYRGWIFWGLQWPALRGAQWVGLSDFHFRIFEPAGGLMLMMYAALAIGCVLAAPLWLWEIVRFINPALTPRERRVAMLLIPGAIALFLAGAAFCYVISPIFFAFLFKFNVSLGVSPEVAMIPYLKFFVLCLVVFGLSFELPLVLLFLVYLGVLDAATLVAKWRTALVLIVVLAAIATPTTDPLTMTLMAAPMALLYFLSIWLAKWVERPRGEEPLQILPAADPDDPYGLHADAMKDPEEPER